MVSSMHLYSQCKKKIIAISERKKKWSHKTIDTCKYCQNVMNEGSKGQIISKGLFVTLEFSQKTNKRIRRSSKNEFIRSFFGEFEDTKSPFEIIWPLEVGHWVAQT